MTGLKGNLKIENLKTDNVKAEEKSRTEERFSKEQIVKSKQFDRRKDIVNALLSDNEKYTIKSVEEMIKKYMKGEVK